MGRDLATRFELFEEQEIIEHFNKITDVHSNLPSRGYDPGIGRFTGVDPKAINYQDWTVYAYTLNNPVLLTDPSGMAPEIIHPESEGALNTIRATLSEEDRKYIRLDENGNIDQKLINSYESSSTNYNKLKEMVNSSMLLEVTLDDSYEYIDEYMMSHSSELTYFAPDKYFQKDTEGNRMGRTSTGESGFLGKTLFPDLLGLENSSTNAIQTIIHEKLSPEGRA